METGALERVRPETGRTPSLYSGVKQSQLFSTATLPPLWQTTGEVEQKSRQFPMPYSLRTYPAESCGIVAAGQQTGRCLLHEPLQLWSEGLELYLETRHESLAPVA